MADLLENISLTQARPVLHPQIGKILKRAIYPTQNMAHPDSTTKTYLLKRCLYRMVAHAVKAAFQQLGYTHALLDLTGKPQ